jgi:hypothetical protein
MKLVKSVLIRIEKMVEAPGMPRKMKKDDNSQSPNLIMLDTTFICLNLVKI